MAALESAKFYQPQSHKKQLKIAKYSFSITEAYHYVTNGN